MLFNADTTMCYHVCNLSVGFLFCCQAGESNTRNQHKASYSWPSLDSVMVMIGTPNWIDYSNKDVAGSLPALTAPLSTMTADDYSMHGVSRQI